MADLTGPLVTDSILQSTKKLLGLEAEFNAYDLDITIHINSAFSTLFQAGVGPTEGFFIENAAATWDQFTGTKMYMYNVKTYIYLSVKLVFDPPTSSFGLAAIEKQLEETIWRLNVADDHSNQLINLSADVIPGNNIDDIVYNLSGGSDFPRSAPIGALGIDIETGKLYRKG